MLCLAACLSATWILTVSAVGDKGDYSAFSLLTSKAVQLYKDSNLSNRNC